MASWAKTRGLSVNARREYVQAMNRRSRSAAYSDAVDAQDARGAHGVSWTLFCGGSCRTRTYNPLIKSQLLCQLS
jgi:hypothetical protein